MNKFSLSQPHHSPYPVPEGRVTEVPQTFLNSVPAIPGTESQSL